MIVFLFRRMKSTKRVFPTIYIFFNDIRLFLIAYNLISTYFRRLNRTSIAIKIADHVLIHIFKNYLIPRFVFTSSIQGKTQIEKKGNVKDTPLQFRDIYLINKLKNNLNDFEDLLQFLDNESLDLAKSHIDNIIKSLSLRLDNNYENDIKENSFKIKY